MKKLFTILSLLLAVLSYGKKADYTKYVDPMIGTGGHGHVFVGASVPHGMVQVGPNNLTKGWDWCSGYHDQDSVIIGFAQTHLSGTGISDLGDIVFMPVTGRPSVKRSVPEDLTVGFASKFSKANQVVTPGYYSVLLERYGVRAELTASERVAQHRYTYPAKSESSVIIDLNESTQSLMMRKGCTDSYIKVGKDGLVTGYRKSDEWAKDHKVYFAARFAEPIIEWQIYSNDEPVKGDSVAGTNIKLRLIFGNSKVVNSQVGISYTSVDGAIKNLKAESSTFDKVKKNAYLLWNKQLSKVDFQTKDASAKRIFYTAQYHIAISPSLFADIDGKYRGADGKIYTAKGFTPYTIFSLWDTYRGVNPLATLLDERTADYVNTLIDINEKQKRMPVWHLAGNETDCMVGVHSIPVVVDAALKGINGVDASKVFDAVKDFDKYAQNGLQYIPKYGYIPADKEVWSVAKALEYCIDDYAIARLSQKLGYTGYQKEYDKRAKGYVSYFDTTTRFMRGRMADGSWRTPFDPSHSIHMEDDYVEGNAWQYTWLVPHDVDGLISLFGGKERFFQKFDSLFTVSSKLNEGASIDITGMIGQYAHGNEPSHHILYMYAYAGQPWKTAELVRKVYDDFYTTRPDGLIGNEDCGQMSAWYVLSSLGFYPMNPVSGEFVFGSPIIDKATLKLANGKQLRIIAKNNSKQNIYIKKVTLNGVEVNSNQISYDELMRGGELVYFMSNLKNKF